MPRYKSHKAETKRKISHALMRHGMRRTRFYRIWGNIKYRCFNKNHVGYRYYGGNGIKVCKRWLRFENFLSDTFNEYEKHVKKHGEKNTTIDRVNNKLGYSKSNCHWATYKQQNLNTRSNTTTKINGILHRKCKMCGGMKLLKEFPKAVGRYLNRNHRCKRCCTEEAMKVYYMKKSIKNP